MPFSHTRIIVHVHVRRTCRPTGGLSDDLIQDKIPTYGNEFDCVIEAKHKELAVEKYKELHL